MSLGPRDSWGRVRSLTGQSIGHYRIGERIGRGGTGEVYQADDAENGKRVAIKVLASAVCQVPEIVHRFRLEARVVSRIDDPGIVSVLDFGELEDGRAYYAMELLEGRLLLKYLEERGPLDLEETCQILVPVMEALGAAHAAGVVHRDIKPDNIFLCQDNGTPRPKILDFGIAKMLEGEEDGVPLNLTTTGQLLGTPLYMSPEQVAGESSRVGPWSDVYSVGVVLYHMLVGKPPYRGKSFSSILVQHTESPPPRLSPVRTDVPVDLDTVLFRAMAKPTGARYPTMADFRADLLEVKAGRPPSSEWSSLPEAAEPEPTVEAVAPVGELAAPTPRHRSSPGVWITLVLTALVAFSVAVWLALR